MYNKPNYSSKMCVTSPFKQTRNLKWPDPQSGRKRIGDDKVDVLVQTLRLEPRLRECSRPGTNPPFNAVRAHCSCLKVIFSEHTQSSDPFYGTACRWHMLGEIKISRTYTSTHPKRPTLYPARPRSSQPSASRVDRQPRSHEVQKQ